MNRAIREYVIPYVTLLSLISSCFLILNSTKTNEIVKTIPPAPIVKTSAKRTKRQTADVIAQYLNKDHVLVQPAFIIKKQGQEEPELVSFISPEFNFDFNNLNSYEINFIPSGTVLFLTDETEEYGYNQLLFKYKNKYIKYRYEAEGNFLLLINKTELSRYLEATWPRNPWILNPKDLKYDEKIITDLKNKNSSFKMIKCIALQDTRFRREELAGFLNTSYTNAMALSEFEHLKELLIMFKLDSKIKLYSYSLRKEFLPTICLLSEYEDLLSYLLFKNLPKL